MPLRQTLLGLAFLFALGSPSAWAQDNAEEAAFTAPTPAPKHRLSALAVPKNVAATWSLEGQDFSFQSNSLGYGVAYELVATARLAVSLEYVHSSLKLKPETAGAYSFAASTADYDTYFAKLRYCFYGTSNFFQQICPGIDIGNDAYPALSLVGPGQLQLDTLQDIVAGVNITYSSPVTERVLFRSTAGYNYGLGIGNSAALTSKSNSSYYLKLGAGWDVTPSHGFGVDVFWQTRNTSTADKTGLMDKSWTTKSTELGLRLSYMFTL